MISADFDKAKASRVITIVNNKVKTNLLKYIRNLRLNCPIFADEAHILIRSGDGRKISAITLKQGADDYKAAQANLPSPEINTNIQSFFHCEKYPKGYEKFINKFLNFRQSVSGHI